MELTTEEKERLSNAANLIAGTFDWEKSDEGHEYWKTVNRNLRRYSRQVERCPLCGGIKNE